MKIGGPGPSKTTVCHWRVCTYHYVYRPSKSHQNGTNMFPNITQQSIQYDLGSILENIRKHCPTQCRKVDLKEAHKWSKIIKKGSSEHALSLMGALGRPRAPRDHFVMDFGSIFLGFWVDYWWMWEAIVCISWVSFSIMRYHSLRRFPVPLVSTGISLSIYIFRKVSPRHWRFMCEGSL